MYGVRVNVDFLVRKIDRVRVGFLNGVRVRVRKKFVPKSWCVIRKEYGNVLKNRVRVRNLRRKIYGLHFFSFVSVSDQYFIKILYHAIFPRRSRCGQCQFLMKIYPLQ